MARLQIPPLEASDGTLAIVYRVASHVYGEWNVTWPQDYDAPELQPGREQGYVSRLPGGEPPPFGRRFVRQDVSIDAINGESNVERTLDEAADSLSGEVVVEREIGPEGLGNLKLGVDFKKGDLVPVAIATKVLELPVTRATYRDEAGQLTEPTIGVGYSLLVDRSGLASHNEESERRIAADLRDLAPRLKAVETTARDNATQVDVAKKTASDAKTVAQTANSAATQAQTSADGKSTVFYGATTPAKAKAGDTWFKDVAGGTVLMQYVNGKWVEKVNAKAIDDELAANKSALEDNDAALTELNDVTLPALDKRLEDNERAVGPELTAKLSTLKEELEALDTVITQEAAAKLATLETKLANADKALKEDLQGELAALDEALSGDLTSKLAGLKGELEALDTEVAREAAANLATLETKLTNADKALKEGLQGELAALDEALSGNLTSSLAGLKEELKALDADVASEAASKLATLETKLANADKALKETLQGEIAALDEALSGELASSLTTLKDELEAADAAAAAAVSTTLVQLENRLKAADKALKTDLVAQLGELESDLAALDTAVGENLTAKLAALRTELQQADATVRTTLRGELSTLKTQLQNADTAVKNNLVDQIAAARKALEDADKDINTDLSKRLEDTRKDLKAASDTIATDLAGVDMLVHNQRPGNLFPDPFFKHSLWGSRYNAEEECLEITATGSTTGAYYFPDGYNVYSHLMTLEPGASYLLTIDARFGGNEVVKHATIYCRYCDVAGDWKTAALGRIDRTNEVNYKWGTTSLVLTMPDNVSSEATLGFYISSEYDSGHVRLRNVRLHRAADNSLIIDGAVTAAKVKAGVIDADHIAAGAIVATKLAADSVVAGKIAANAVTANSIAANQVTTAKIAAGAVTANEILSDTILAKNIKAGQITTAKIAADAVTANEIAANAVTANAIKAGEVTTAKLAADAVTANKVAADAILARNIKAGQITTAKIATDAVTANEIASNQILAKHIKAGEITTAKIAANQITTAKIAAGAVTADELQAENATIDKLWANGIAAKSVITNRVLVAGNGNMLPEIATYAAASSKPEIDPYPRPFGLNTGHPSIWAQGRGNCVIHHPLNLVAGQKYRFSYGVSASVDGTRHFWQFLNGTADGLTGGGVSVKVRGTTSSYLINNEVANKAIREYMAEFEPITTGTYYLQVYPNHTNGTENDSGYQWFRDLRLEKMTGATLIEDGAITTNKIAANAVTANAIKAGEVTTAKIAADAVTANKLAVDSVLAKNIKAGQITTAKIAADAVTANEIASDTILAKNIKAGQITTAKLAANAITANEIAADQILAKHVKADQIVAKHIKSGEIKAEHLLAEEATIDKLWANGLVAKTVQTASLSVGPANLYRDPSLLDADSFDNRRSDTGGYGGGGSFTVAPSTATSGGYDSVGASKGRPTRLTPGTTYYISAMARPDRLVAAGNVRLYLRAYPTADATGSNSWASPQWVSNSVSFTGGVWQRVEGTFTMHQDYEYLALGFYVASGSQAQVVFSDPLLVRQYSSTMIQDGAITTGKVATNAITANELAANSVTANAIKAGEVTATKIASDAISATKLLAEDATIDKLWANGIAAKSVVTNRILVAGNGNLLPEISSYHGSGYPNPDPYEDFGKNSGDPSMWLKGRVNAYIKQPINIVAGQKYRLRYQAKASVNGTSHYLFIRQGNPDGPTNPSATITTKVDGNSNESTYLVSNGKVGTGWATFDVTFEPSTTEVAYIYIYANHTNGTDNPNYQWFKDVRLEKMMGTTLIEDGAVTTGKVAANAITANEINTDAVTAKQIKAGEITGTHISAGKITSRELATDSVTAKQIKSGEITSSHISSSKISSDKITVANGFIKNAMIGNGEVNNAKIANLDASKITAGTINAARIGAKTIEGKHLAVDTIEANQIKANVFTQVANSVLPLIPGTVTPTWTDGLRYVPRSGTKDAELPAGIPGYYRYSSGTIAAGATASVSNTYNNVVSIDPNLEYEATWWVRSSAGSPRFIYVTLEDQNGATDIVQQVEGVDDEGNAYSKHTWGNPIRVIITSASTTWTKYSTIFTFKEGTKSVRVHNVYFDNSTNSSAAYLYIAGLEISPHIIPQREVDARQDQAIGKMEEYVRQLTEIFYSQSASYAKKFNELSEPQSGGLVAGENEDGVLTTTTSKIICDGSWTGHLLIHIMHGTYDGLNVVRREVTGSAREFALPSVSSGSRRPVAIHWFKRPGRAYVADMSTGAQSATYNTWKTLSTTSVGTGSWNLTATVGWDAATNHNKYGIRILVNGSEVARVAPRTGLGPLLPIGDGYRTQSVSASGDGNGRTTKFEIQAYTDATTSASGPRRIRRVNATLDWTKLD